MKYIRTKTGIYLKPDEKFIKGNQVLHFKFNPTHNDFLADFAVYEDIMKESDSIEELCDEFVVFNGKSFVCLLSKKPSEKYKGHEIYAAIWTDKGLIYVAKMNEKGELELL